MALVESLIQQNTTAPSDPLTLGTVTASTALVAGGSLALSGVQTDTSVGTVSDFALGNVSAFRWSGATTASWSGFTGGTEGRVLIVEVTGAGAMVVLNDSASSIAANRIYTPSATSMTLVSGDVLTLRYNGTAQRWRVINFTSLYQNQPVVFNGQVTLGSLVLGGVQNDTSVGATNDYALAANATTVRWAGASAWNLTGLAGGAEGRVVILELNDTGQALTLAHNSASSAAANRIYCPGSALLTISGQATVNAAGTAILKYDGTAQKWRVIGFNSAFNNHGVIFAGSTNIAGLVSVSGIQNNTTTGTQNDLALGNVNTLMWAGAAPSVITGFSGGANGRILIIDVLSASALTLAHENAGSVAANRLSCPQGVDAIASSLIATGAASATFRYDSAISRWKLIGLLSTTCNTVFKYNDTLVSNAQFYANGRMVLGAVSPTAIGAGPTPNYAPAGASLTSFIRQDLTANAVVSGLVIPSMVDGLLVTIQNVNASFTLTLTNEDVASVTTNRFLLPGNASLVIAVNGVQALRYDATSARWRVA